MKNKSFLPASVQEKMTPLAVVLVILLALAAVASAYFQMGRGPLAPTAPQSNPAASMLSSNDNTCRITFNVDEALTPVANLEVQKEVSDSTPAVGDQVTFTILLINKGPDDATGVTVRDIIPNGVTHVSDSTANGNYDETTGTWTVGTIPANTTYTLNLVVTVDVSTQVTNIAQVWTSETDDPNSEPGNNNPDEDDYNDSTINPIIPGANLSLMKVVSNATPQRGQNITYTLRLVNDGPDEATGVTVKDVLPSVLTYVNHTVELGSYDPATGMWNVGTIAPNTDAELSVIVTVNTSSPVTNVAQVWTSETDDPNSEPGNSVSSEDDQSTVTVVPPSTVTASPTPTHTPGPAGSGADLSLEKRVNNQAPKVGDEVVFTLELNNAGPNQANNVTVRDLIPQGVTFLGANASQGGYNSGDGTWNVGSITKGTTARLEMRVRITSSNQIRNIAQVWTSSESDPDSVPGNNDPDEDDYDERVLGQAGLPRAGSNSRTTLFVVAVGVVVLIVGAVGVLLLL